MVASALFVFSGTSYKEHSGKRKKKKRKRKRKEKDKGNNKSKRELLFEFFFFFLFLFPLALLFFFSFSSGVKTALNTRFHSFLITGEMKVREELVKVAS